MSKNALTSYSLPNEIERRYYRLMNSKESFLVNLSNAERAKLSLNLINLQDTNKQDIQQITELLVQELIPYELSLKKKRVQSIGNIKTMENDFLDSWKEKILIEAKCPTELKTYLTQNEL